jgi:cell division inhibitor SulA
MNPILHDLQNKQWVWTAANAKQQVANPKLSTGYENLDKVLSGGFPIAGMIHIQSYLGCGEMRLMLSILRQQHKAHNEQKLCMFIDPPFELNAEFLLSQNIELSQIVVIRTHKMEDALWSAEQSAKSGACSAVFIWQHHLKHLQVRKLEHAALKGNCYCIWLHNRSNAGLNSGLEHNHSPEQSNLPLSLSLSLSRQDDKLTIKVNKQKIGWAQKAVQIPLPFNSRINSSLRRRQQYSANGINKVIPICANNSRHK